MKRLFSRQTMVIFAVTFFGLLYYFSQHPFMPAKKQELVFPELKDMITDINLIVVTYKNSSLHLDYKNNYWLVREADHKEADIRHIRNFISALSETMFLEEKTDNPKKYHYLGVDDAQAIKVAIYTENEDQPPALSFNIGYKMTPLKGTYLLMQKDPHVWLVSGDLIIDTEPKAWLAPKTPPATDNLPKK